MVDRPRRHHTRYGIGARLAFIACWLALFSGSLLIVVVPSAPDPVAVHAIGVLMAGVTGFFMLRSLRWATIDVYGDRVVVREILRSAKVPIAEISGFILVPVVNQSSASAKALAVRTQRGTTIVFGDFWSSGEGDSFSVEEIAERLNTEVAASAQTCHGRDACSVTG